MNNATYDTTVSRIFEDVIANHCYLPERETDFICTPEFSREKLQALNIQSDYDNNYHDDENVPKMEGMLNTIDSTET